MVGKPVITCTSITLTSSDLSGNMDHEVTTTCVISAADIHREEGVPPPGHLSALFLSLCHFYPVQKCPTAHHVNGATQPGGVLLGWGGFDDGETWLRQGSGVGPTPWSGIRMEIKTG
uniref:Uncharacterized protein n=1 Tax=Bionectria ochroleuca TaxID=29856 RepID=A0A8H7NI83_BIOOC